MKPTNRKDTLKKKPKEVYLDDNFDESNIGGNKADPRDNLESYNQLLF